AALRLPRRPGVDPAERHLPPAAAAGAAARPAALQVADDRVAGHVEHVPLVLPAEPGAEVGRAAELVVAGDPGVGQALAAALQQVGGDPPPLLELHPVGDVAPGPARPVGGPSLGQVEPPVQGGVAAGGGIDQEDAALAVLLLPEPAAPLPGDAAGVGPGLRKGAGVDHQHRPVVAQFLADVAPQLGHDRLVVPLAGAGEELDGLAVHAGLHRDRLAGLAL